MKKVMKVGLGIALASIALLLTIWFGFPKTTSDFLLSTAIAATGLQEKTVETSFGTVHYLEGGNGPTVLLAHGIFARKEHWVEMATELTDAYRVILLDVPGFGANKILPEGKYTFNAQADHLAEVVQLLDIQDAHLGGNSMGGQLSGMLAVRMPERFRSVAFIGSPAGVKSPQKSDMEIAIEGGDIPLLVTTPEEYEKRMPYLFPSKPYAPWPVEKTMREQELALAKTNKRIWHDVVESKDVVWLLDLAPKITQPAAVIWCDQDRIFHPSGAPVLTAALPKGELFQLKGCGHVPMIDKPADTGVAYRKFLDSLH